jgi:hypothetical protein
MAAMEPHLIRSVPTYYLQGYTGEDNNGCRDYFEGSTYFEMSSGVPDGNNCSLELYGVQQRAAPSLQMQI